MNTLTGGLGGAIGCKYLKGKNRLVFVEFGGAISKYDFTPGTATIVSQGSILIKGTFSFDCESGTLVPFGSAADVWWEQMTAVKRQMVPQGTAKITNLGTVDFSQVTPAVLAALPYASTPIPGNNDVTNKLVPGDVFCVKTGAGNYCKLQVVSYDYDLKVNWVTYKPNPAYAKIGLGYTQPEDIVVAANELTAYVTERSGNIVKIDLNNANRGAASVKCSGLTAPHQLYVDEATNTAYVVEFANPGRLLKIDLNSGTKTPLYSNLKNAVGLVLSADLKWAYVSEQGLNAITRIEIATGTKTTIATGFSAPFFLSWADASQTRLLVADRDPANKIMAVDVTKTTANITLFTGDVAFRPSSIAATQPGNFCVCCDAELDRVTPVTSAAATLYKGVGYVPWNLVVSGPAGDPNIGKADTTTQPAYPFQFAKNSPFGGTLPLMVDHRRAWDAGIAFYQVLLDGVARFDSWSDLVMNPSTGFYDTDEPQKPDAAGFYAVHNPVKVYYNSDLGSLLASTSLANGLHTLQIKFYDAAKSLKFEQHHPLFINNDPCVAVLDMPMIETHAADPNCGYLKYTGTEQNVILHWAASHPQGFATYTFSIIKGANGFDGVSGALVPPATSFSMNYIKTVALLLGSCPGVAAFAESLYVATTVINGVGRQSQYDAGATVAFCLAP